MCVFTTDYHMMLNFSSAFDPPRHPAGMKALLEHSMQNYRPLPSEDCDRVVCALM